MLKEFIFPVTRSYSASKTFFCCHQDMGIVNFDLVPKIHDSLMQSVEESAAVRFRQDDMIAMRPAEGNIFICRINLHGMKLIPVPVHISVFQGIFIAK